MKKTAFLYVRIACAEKTTPNGSADEQFKELLKHCQLHDIEAKHLFFDIGNENILERYDIKKMLFFLENGFKADLLLFTRWDRISKKESEVKEFLEKVKGYEITPLAIKLINKSKGI